VITNPVDTYDLTASRYTLSQLLLILMEEHALRCQDTASAGSGFAASRLASGSFWRRRLGRLEFARTRLTM